MKRLLFFACSNKRRLLLWFLILIFSIMVTILGWNITDVGFSVFREALKTNAILKLEQNPSANSAYLFSYTNSSDDFDLTFGWCQSHLRTTDNFNHDAKVVSAPDCDRIFSGNNETIDQAKIWVPPCAYDDEMMANISCDCNTLKKFFHFQSLPLSEEERNYPLAFIMIVEKYAEQVIRLLASLYQPQNIFCLSYDEHSKSEFKKAMQCLGSCFDNVFLPKTHLEIFWADVSILQATLNCMTLLINEQKNHEWKYVQILSWNDLPLRTNLEMVRIFKILNGSTDSELAYGQAERFRKFHFQGEIDSKKEGILRSVPPLGLTIYKGSFAVSLPREFSDYIVNNPAAQQLFSWSQSMWAPEEQFWSTLIHNTHLNHTATFPGACLHYYKLENKEKSYISRFQVWNSDSCRGQMISESCCFGVGDLPMLKIQPALVAHKFYADYQPAAWYCILKSHHDRTYNLSNAFSTAYPFNISYYENLPAVRYQTAVNKSEFNC